MEGGEVLELSPSRKTSIRYQFESFCKKVLRNERSDYDREQRRRAAREQLFSELPTALLDRLGASDDYQAESYVFEVFGHSVTIRSDRLGEALLDMGTQASDILLLAYCLELSDREIAEALGLTRSTVQRRRQQFLSTIKKRMEE